MKIERLLAITVMLLNRRQVTARLLAEHFEVSVRTIYRDIESLNGAGIPVISCQGYDGGFAIPDNYKLSRQLLTFEDMLSILSTLKGVNRTLQNIEVDRAIEKISALIPEDKEEAYRRHADSFVIDVSSWGMGDRLRASMQLVHRAVSSSLFIRFSYTAADGRKSSRRVEPHSLIFKSFSWYLLAWCETRSDFRIFRLTRMRDIVIETEYFKRRKVDPLRCFAGEHKRPEVNLELKFAPKLRVRVEEYFDQAQFDLEADGSAIVRVSFPEDDWVLSFLLGFGDDMEVLSPARWREIVREKCEKMQKLYTNLT